MERPRFSGKEIAKNAKPIVIIPESYKELREAVIRHSTPSAYLIKFKHNTSNFEEWFPSQYILKKDDKYYCDGWLYNEKTKVK